MKKIILPFLLAFFFSSIAQEKGLVVGHILADGQPVPFVSVVLKNSTTGTTSDENGNFSINVPAGKQTIIVQAIGFKTQEKNINVPENGKIHLDFNLEESVF